VSDVWSELRTAAAVNPALEFRALRNWHVTILDDELGFELAEIGRRVGHSRASSTATGMTARYSLSDKKVDAEMAAGVAARLAEIDDLAVTLRSPRGGRNDTAGRAAARRKARSGSTEISPH